MHCTQSKAILVRIYNIQSKIFCVKMSKCKTYIVRTKIHIKYVKIFAMYLFINLKLIFCRPILKHQCLKINLK